MTMIYANTIATMHEDEGDNDETPPPVASIDVRVKSFTRDSQSQSILTGIRFNVNQHEFLGILGPSGCGKTTLLRLIAALDTEYEGSIIVNGHPVRQPGQDRGLVFQESRLLPWFSVERNVAFALPSSRSKATKSALSKATRRERVANALRLVGLSGHARAWPFQLSGGEAKRVALARALVNLPQLLLMDEPFSALDSSTQYRLQEEIERIHREERLATIMVTHDIKEAVYLSDRIVLLTEKPTRIKAIVDVPLMRPRNRTTPEFSEICADILKKVLQ